MSSATLISDDLQTNIAGLNSRVDALTKRFKAMLPVLVVLSVVTAVLGFIASSASPNVYLTDIDLPANLLTHFKESVESGVSALDGSQFEGISEMLVGIMKTFPILILVVGFIFVGFKLLFSNEGMDGGAIIKVVLPVILVGGTIPMVSSMLGVDGDDDQSKSARELFIIAVNDHRADLVTTYLKDVSQNSSPAGLYVLAQLSLVKDVDISQAQLKINPDLVSTITSNNAGFMPAQNVLFALEKAAFGEAKTEPARAYEQSSKNKQQLIKAWATAFSAIAIAFGFVCGGIFMLREILRRRVNRIQVILNPKTPNA